MLEILTREFKVGDRHFSVAQATKALGVSFSQTQRLLWQLEMMGYAESSTVIQASRRWRLVGAKWLDHVALEMECDLWRRVHPNVCRLLRKGRPKAARQLLQEERSL